MLILIAKLSSIRAIDIERKNWINDQKKKTIHGVQVYVFSETGFRNMFYQYKKSSKTERQKMKIVETVHE